MARPRAPRRCGGARWTARPALGRNTARPAQRTARLLRPRGCLRQARGARKRDLSEARTRGGCCGDSVAGCGRGARSSGFRARDRHEAEAAAQAEDAPRRCGGARGLLAQRSCGIRRPAQRSRAPCLCLRGCRDKARGARKRLFRLRIPRRMLRRLGCRLGPRSSDRAVSERETETEAVAQAGTLRPLSDEMRALGDTLRGEAGEL